MERESVKVRVEYQPITDCPDDNRIIYGEMKKEVRDFPEGGDTFKRWVDDQYPQWDNDGLYGTAYGCFHPKVFDMEGNLLYERKDPEWT